MTRTEAIAIAKATAERNQWTWREPVEANRRLTWLLCKRWHVVSNADNRGCNVRIDIDDLTGDVLQAAFCPR